ncbi:MAG: SGNH/GDSL hydrolase family protein [Solirubrobacterales bacterium]
MAVGRLLAVAILFLAAACSSAPKPPQQLSYMAIGASDAVGIGAFPLDRGYVYRIRDELRRNVERVDLLNLGIPGASAEMEAQVVRTALDAGKRPGLVTIWLGGNDVVDGVAPKDFETHLEDILDRLRKRTDAVIAVANLPDLSRTPRFQQNPSPNVTPARIQAFNAAIARQVKDHDALLVDLANRFGDLSELTSDIDGYHPNSGGHAVVASAFLAEIEPALGIRPKVALSAGR